MSAASGGQHTPPAPLIGAFSLAAAAICPLVASGYWSDSSISSG
jgi:hypothetical protein